MSNKRNNRKLDLLSGIKDEIIERNSIKRYVLMMRAKAKARRRMVVGFSSIAACLLAAVLGVVLLLSGLIKQVPVYRGMTVSSTPNGGKTVAVAEDRFLLDAAEAPSSTPLRGFAALSGNETGTGDATTASEPATEAETEPPVQIEGAGAPIYYAEKNQDVYITVHIDNPDDFEILSFTLNGKKYSSYMFEEGSDMENLILKVNVGDAEGVVEYTIDAIKYVDGTEIKDVRMAGDKTVRVGIATEKQPTATLSDLTVGLYDVAYTVSSSDPLSLIEKSGGGLYAVLLQNGETVATKELTVGATEQVSFTGLPDKTVYRVLIVAKYDALDGEGFTEVTLAETTVQTKTVVSFDELQVTDDSVSFGFVWSSLAELQEISAIALFDGDEKLLDLSPNALQIDGLLSNHTYRIEATFPNRNGSDTIEVTFTTSAKTAPTYTVSTDSITQTGFAYGVTESDPDSIGSIVKIELLHGTDAPIDLGLSLEGAQSGLLSNNDYTVRVTYTYDLNDGTGVKTDAVTKTVRTEAKTAPTYTVNTDSITQTGFAYDVTKSDPDGIGSIVKIELLHGTDAPIDLGLSLEGARSELLSNNDYTVRVTYTYDLHDGTGVKTDAVTKTVRTEAKTAPTYTVNTDSITQTGFAYDVTKSDPDGIGSIVKIELLHGTDAPIDLGLSLEGARSELLSNNDYTVRVTYTYDLNDGTGVKTETVTKTVRTEAKTAPTYTMELGTITENSISYSYTLTDPDNLVAQMRVYLLDDSGVPLAFLPTSNAFTGLTQARKYTVVLEYSYDLNDGRGVLTDTVRKDAITSLASVSFQSITTFGETIDSGETLSLQLRIEAVENVRFTSITIAGQEIPIVKNGNYYYASFVPTMGSGIYRLAVEAVGYELYGTETRSLAVDYDSGEQVVILGEIEIGDITLSNGKDSFYAYESGVTGLIDLIGSEPYTMKTMTIYEYGSSYNQFVLPLTHVSGTVYSFPLSALNYREETVNLCDEDFRIKELSYTLGGENMTLTFEENEAPGFYFKRYNHNGNPIEISTPEQLQNMEINGTYVLTQDIDMTGFDWRPICFNGYLDGAGYTIRNLTVRRITHYDISDLQQVGMLYHSKGSVVNLHFENAVLELDLPEDYQGDGFKVALLEVRDVINCTVDCELRVNVPTDKDRVSWLHCYIFPISADYVIDTHVECETAILTNTPYESWIFRPSFYGVQQSNFTYEVTGTIIYRGEIIPYEYVQN